MGQNVISLAKFISRFLGVHSSNLKKLSHEDAKHLFPNLKRATFMCIERDRTKESSGNIILVSDGKKVIPYFAPTFIVEDANLVEVDMEKKKSTFDIPDYSNMKIYELKKLLNCKFNGRHVSRCARRELMDRGVILTKKYKREEFKKWRRDYERD